MSWRIAHQGGEWWSYAVVCPECGKSRGWQTSMQAGRHLNDLELAEFNVTGRAVVEYQDGTDDTCPHGESVPERPARRRKGEALDT